MHLLCFLPISQGVDLGWRHIAPSLSDDHERWQQLDFVVGIEIHLSGNHTCKGRDGKPHKFEDICDQLKGKYPKDFKFTGWHPHCRCHATSIIKTEEELEADTRRMMAGESVDGESVNKVEEVPERFKGWMKENEKRIAEAKSQPYFIRDNKGYVGTRRQETKPEPKFDGIKTNEEIKNRKLAPKPDAVGRFVEISHEDMISKLRELSLHFTHEEAYVKLADGRIYHKIGTDEINFTKEEKAMFRGGELYHNHDYEPPSPQDIAFLYSYKLKSLHAIARDIDFVVSAPKKYKNHSYVDIIDELTNKAAQNLIKKLQNMNSIESDKVKRNMQAYERLELCKILGVGFRAKKIGE